MRAASKSGRGRFPLHFRLHEFRAGSGGDGSFAAVSVSRSIWYWRRRNQRVRTRPAMAVRYGRAECSAAKTACRTITA